ncbi:MAG: hypothetical protein H7A35_04510 [Planctomycetales bacterium]|nr:hypothetical protein [bacterium]UNM09320.1 MAG: hypothetical protein H7A35_04510 [Planctomycetales bacterium]
MSADSPQPDKRELPLPERERRYMSGPHSIEQLELGQQITTEQAERIISELIEADVQFRRTPRKPEPYRARYRKGD